MTPEIVNYAAIVIFAVWLCTVLWAALQPPHDSERPVSLGSDGLFVGKERDR